MRRFAGSLILTTLLALPLMAQVGYMPGESPFRSITHATWLELYGGRLYGSGGPIPVAPRDGNLYGARIAFRARHATQIGLGLWQADAIRNVVDPYEPQSRRVTGPFPARTMGIETTVQFNVTGTKSWHRLAPYSSLSVGFAFATTPRPVSDTSGYNFGTKTYFGPALGSRIFLGERVSLRAEARANIWKMKYPESYFLEPQGEAGIPGVSSAVNTTGNRSDLVISPMLIFGLGWGF